MPQRLWGIQIVSIVSMLKYATEAIVSMLKYATEAIVSMLTYATEAIVSMLNYATEALWQAIERPASLFIYNPLYF